MPAHLRAFTLAAMRRLVAAHGLPLARLVRMQQPIVQRLVEQIDERRERAVRRAFRQFVLDGGWELAAGPAHVFRFGPAVHPVSAGARYRGRFTFSKHFHPVLADLEDGTEEWQCAVAIDRHPRVRHWVRNLDSDPIAGFWLPISAVRLGPRRAAAKPDSR